MSRNYLVLPAYNPEGTLLTLLRELSADPGLSIIVVNDGSLPQYESLFREAGQWATVLAHAANQGKGRALKTAFSYILQQSTESGTVVTADADGQHRAADIQKVLYAAKKSPSSFYRQKLVLGVRQFAGKVPFRSRFGNMATSVIFRLLTGVSLDDTQTGLRACSTDLLPLLLSVRGERYEYEMNVLLTCTKKDIELEEIPIETIYLEENHYSHFRVIRDSAKIYWNILRFFLSSLLCFCVDYSLFCLLPFGVFFNNILARLISASLNFTLNRCCVFRHTGSLIESAVGYALLALGILCANTAILFCFIDLCGLRPMAAKLITECLLWIVSFSMQQFVVFRKTI